MSISIKTRPETTLNPIRTFAAMQNGHLQRQCAYSQNSSAGGEYEECKKKREGTLQRAVVNSSPINEVAPVVYEALCSPGRPLDPATHAFIEARFGHDFSQVRVNTDTKAAESARAVNALAFTVGHDVIIVAGQYSPNTKESQRLIAHELVQVVLQSPGTMLRQAVTDETKSTTGAMTTANETRPVVSTPGAVHPLNGKGSYKRG